MQVKQLLLSFTILFFFGVADAQNKVSSKAQIIKIDNLEIYKKDLSTTKMTIVQAEKAIAALGNGWRLPSILELKNMYDHKNEIGNFQETTYWSGSKFDDFFPMYFKFYSGNSDYDTDFKYTSHLVRPVRSK